MKKIYIWVLIMTICGAVNAAVLKRAEITAIMNDVRIADGAKKIERPAQLKDEVKGKAAVNTGVKSRAELLFEDKTLARLGANTVFSFDEGTRNMDLKKGTMLLQVPKGAGGANVRTAAVTAAITGTTVMIESQPGQLAKVIVLEGTLKLYLKGTDQFIILKPGQMISVDPKATTLPEPVDVDLKALVASSGLVNEIDNDNLEMGLISDQIDEQEKLKKDGALKKVLVVGETTDTLEIFSTVDQAIRAGSGNTNSKPTGAGETGGQSIIQGPGGPY